MLIAQCKNGAFSKLAFKSPASFLAEAYENEHGGVAGVAAWREDGVSSVSGYHYNAYLDSFSFDIYGHVKQDGIGAPTLIVHGESDSIVPIEQSRRVSLLAGDRSVLLKPLAGVDHGYKEDGAKDEMIKHIANFISL